MVAPQVATVRVTNTPPGTLQLTKVVTTLDGSAVPAIAGTYRIEVTCVSPDASTFVTDTALSAGGTANIAVENGATCTAIELVAANPPSGYLWQVASSNDVTVPANQTRAITVTNTLVPYLGPTVGLTVTKRISGTEPS